MPRLDTLAASWGQVRGSLRFARRLQHFFVLSYSETGLVPLTAVPTLVSVVMKDYPQVESLGGVEELPRLVELGVHLAAGLRDISALQAAPSSALETLQLSSCRRVTDITPVAACSALLMALI